MSTKHFTVAASEPIAGYPGYPGTGYHKITTNSPTWFPGTRTPRVPRVPEVLPCEIIPVTIGARQLSPKSDIE
eukprot:1362777-Rhodomonas_salina.1